MYEYRATILRVVDGDTVHADIDLGFDTHVQTTLRLAGIDAPEMGSPEGKAAKEFLVGLLARSTVDWLTVQTVKDHKEKFGRYLATLVAWDGLVLNEEMVKAGHARPYGGGKR